MSDPTVGYSARRVDGAKTLGDAYRHRGRDPEAFVAGVQYALDSVLREFDMMRVPLDVAYVEAVAIRVLERAKAGEPQ